MKIIYSTKTTNIYTYISFIIISLLIIADLLLIQDSIRFERLEFYRIYGIFLLLSMFIDVVLVKQLTKRWYCLSALFIVFSYVFHFGQVWLDAYFPDFMDYSTGDLLVQYNDLLRHTFIFCYTVIQCVTAGMCLITCDNRKYRKSGYYLSDDKLRLAGWMICIVLLPSKTLFTIKAMLSVHLNGYDGTAELQRSGAYYTIISFYLIGFLLLLIGYRNNKRTATGIFIAEILYILATMLSGGRGDKVGAILVLLFCYTTIVRKIEPVKLVFVIPAAYIALQFIVGISVVRTMKGFDLHSVIEIIQDPNYNMVLRVLDEFGSTLLTPIYTIKNIPSFRDYAYGAEYIYGFSQIGININGILDGITEAAQFNRNIGLDMNAGGSYIGELYYNFGDYSYPFAVLTGVFIGKISRKADETLRNQDFILFLLYAMPMMYSILWVRSFFAGFWRHTVWGYFFIMAVYKVCKYIKIGAGSNRARIKYNRKNRMGYERGGG